MNSRERWINDTRESVARLLHQWQVPFTAAGAEGELDIDRWTSIGPLTRTPREIGAALRWLEERGLVERVPAVEFDDDTRGPLFIITDHGDVEVRKLIASKVEKVEHKFDASEDRCTCGGMPVYFEDGDDDGYRGEGCEVAGRVWSNVRQAADDREREREEFGDEPSLADWNVTVFAAS